MRLLITFVSFLVASHAVCHADVTDDLLAYYDFEATGILGLVNKAPGASGTDATEGGTGSYAGVAGGAAGNAAEFTGTTGDFINAPFSFGPGATDLGESFSVAAWYNLDTNPSSDTSRFFVFESADDWDISYGLRDYSSGDGLANTQTYTKQAVNVMFTDAHTAGTWQHVVVTYTENAGITTIKTYIDGVYQAGNDISPDQAIGETGGINIGNARSSQLNRAFDGKIDEFAVWDRALTDGEVSAVHAIGLAGEPLVSTTGVLVIVTSDAMGTVSGGGYYPVGAEASISATADPGYAFLGWTGDFAGQPASFTYTATVDVVSAATFGPDTSDTDLDGLSAFEEVTIHGTLPDNPDTDGDGILDGTEVNETLTNPLVSDQPTIDFLAANYSASSVGGIVLSTSFDLDWNPGEVALVFSLLGSSDGASWSAVDPSASLTQTGLDAVFPAPSASVDTYQLYSTQP